jgi:hypothetical protein
VLCSSGVTSVDEEVCRLPPPVVARFLVGAWRPLRHLLRDDPAKSHLLASLFFVAEGLSIRTDQFVTALRTLAAGPAALAVLRELAGPAAQGLVALAAAEAGSSSPSLFADAEVLAVPRAGPEEAAGAGRVMAELRTSAPDLLADALARHIGVDWSQDIAQLVAEIKPADTLFLSAAQLLPQLSVALGARRLAGPLLCALADVAWAALRHGLPGRPWMWRQWLAWHAAALDAVAALSFAHQREIRAAVWRTASASCPDGTWLVDALCYGRISQMAVGDDGTEDAKCGAALPLMLPVASARPVAATLVNCLNRLATAYVTSSARLFAVALMRAPEPTIRACLDAAAANRAQAKVLGRTLRCVDHGAALDAMPEPTKKQTAELPAWVPSAVTPWSVYAISADRQPPMFLQCLNDCLIKMRCAACVLPPRDGTMTALRAQLCDKRRRHGRLCRAAAAVSRRSELRSCHCTPA